MKKSDLIDHFKNETNNHYQGEEWILVNAVTENIQWAWDNWDIDFSDYFDGEKPEDFTPAFAIEWIENEPFETEYEQGILTH